MPPSSAAGTARSSGLDGVGGLSGMASKPGGGVQAASGQVLCGQKEPPQLRSGISEAMGQF